MLLNKMKKIEKNKLDVRRSDEKLQKTLQDWGTSKAQREKQSLAKIGKINILIIKFFINHMIS